jgi:hypothetical protein
MCVFQRLKAGKMELEDTAVPRQRLDIHFLAATHTHTNKITVGAAVFSAVRVASNIQYAVKGE